MANTLTFANGDAIPVLMVVPGVEYFSGSERPFLSIHINGDLVPYDTVRQLSSDTEAIRSLIFTEQIDEESVVTTEYNDYIIPINIISYANEISNEIEMRIARRTESEVIQAELNSANEEIQMALVELGNAYAELEERYNQLLNSTETINTEEG